MKVVVFAYHNIGCTGIEALVAAGFSIQAVFTHEDDPEEERFFKSVKELCLTLKLPVYAPSNVNLPEWTDLVRQLEPEMLFSFFYRRILKGQILELGVKGAYNLHPSLLPRYRGCCPANWVLINGETETGVTLHQMVEKVDAGEILAQKAVPIDRQDTAKLLHMKLDMATKSLLADILPKIFKEETSPIPQDERISSYYGKRKPGDGVIHWEGSAERVFNLVRALTQPYPGAFTYIGQKKITIWEAATEEEESDDDKPPGTVVSVSPLLKIACGRGRLAIQVGSIAEGPRMPASQMVTEAGLAVGQQCCQVGTASQSGIVKN